MSDPILKVDGWRPEYAQDAWWPPTLSIYKFGEDCPPGAAYLMFSVDGEVKGVYLTTDSIDKVIAALQSVQASVELTEGKEP